MRLIRSAALITLGCALSAASYASTSASVSVFPTATPRTGTVTIRTGVHNSAATAEAVTVSITVNNPGECVRKVVPTNTGAIAMPLAAWETRVATLSLKIPADACAGTYTVKILVKNAAGTVVASRTTTFTVNPVP